jgi:TRAP-type C4-dicarboxylate transport system substrate-binding protein
MLKTLSATSLSVALAAVFAASGAATSPAAAATKYCDGPKVTWKISLFGKRRAVTEGVEAISQYAKDQTCGNFDYKIYYGEQLSKAKENLDGIKVGALEGGYVCASYHPGKLRALGVLDLPFLPIYDFDTMTKVYDTLWERKELIDSLARWGAKRHLQTILPRYEYMGRGTPPKTLEDFKGKRLRALGGMGEAAKEIGAVPTTMPAPETYTALQRGTVDAVGFPFSYTFAAYKLDEISTWYTTNMSAGMVNCITAINQAAWDKLPKQYQAILDEALPGAYKAMIEAYGKEDKINLPKWEKEGKMTAVTFTEAELAKFQRLGGEPVWNKWVQETKEEVPTAQALLDLVLKTAADLNKSKSAKK